MRVQTIIRHGLGFLFGFSVFLVGIPSALYLISSNLDRYVSITLISDERTRVAISSLIGIVGLAFIVWSNAHLLLVGKGGPADGFGVAISPRSQHLVTSGPYRHTRNPMVFGAQSLYLAVAIFLNSAICVAVVASFVVLSLIYLKLVEEKRLVRDFGAAYEQYRSEVPMLVPFRLGKRK